MKDRVIRWFIRRYHVDMSEAAEPDPGAYGSFNEFFTRPLREGARPIAEADIVCPADGAVSQIGQVTEGRILQAKGQSFTVTELLGGDDERAAAYAGGAFATIYLSPRDYHRVHMPMAAKLNTARYVAGDLYSVNAVTAENVERLFARNERLVCHFDTAAGPMVMVLVGAMVVAGIETVWSGRVVPAPRGLPEVSDLAVPAPPLALARGEEMGRFFLGSTVILLFPTGVATWDPGLAAGSGTRVGEALGSLSV